jgi:hypothetical protein
MACCGFGSEVTRKRLCVTEDEEKSCSNGMAFAKGFHVCDFLRFTLKKKSDICDDIILGFLVLDYLFLKQKSLVFAKSAK